MKNTLAVLMGTLMSTIFGVPAVMAQPACVTQNMAVPAGANTGDKAQPFFIDTTGLDFSTKPPTRDPNEPELSARDGTARRDAAADRCRGQLHHRPDPCPRTRDRGEGRRSTRHDHLVHHLVEGERDLQSGPDPRRHTGLLQQLDHDHDDGAGRQVEHGRHHQPSRHLDAHHRRLCAGELCAAARRRRSSCSATAARPPTRTWPPSSTI